MKGTGGWLSQIVEFGEPVVGDQEREGMRTLSGTSDYRTRAQNKMKLSNLNCRLTNLYPYLYSQTRGFTSTHAIPYMRSAGACLSVNPYLCSLRIPLWQYLSIYVSTIYGGILQHLSQFRYFKLHDLYFNAFPTPEEVLMFSELTNIQ